MKKTLFLTLILSVSSSLYAKKDINNTNSCLIGMKEYKTLSKKELLAFAKKCKNKPSLAHNYIIDKVKTKNIVVTKTTYHDLSKNVKLGKPAVKKTDKQVSVSKKPMKTVKIIKSGNIKSKMLKTTIIKKKTKHQNIEIAHKKVKKPDIFAKMNLPTLLKYAIKHNLTNSKIGKLIIKKSQNYSNLDQDYINDLFSSYFTKQNLIQLLNTLKKDNE